MRATVAYETQHGCAKRIAEVVADKLGVGTVSIDTPFEIEELSRVDSLVLVCNFRGLYTAQLTKLYLTRVKEQLRNKHIYLIGEGLFSEKEFPAVADEIREIARCQSFTTYFVKGQLRVETLYPEEIALLGKFSEITGIRITDMGEFDATSAELIADMIHKKICENTDSDLSNSEKPTQWMCLTCGYIQTSENSPEKCPICRNDGFRM